MRSDPMPTPGLPSRASAVNSVTDASSNGRSVTLPRWNKHYLIPKLNTGDDLTDPVASFVAPDWVMLTGEEGAAVLSTPKTDSNGNAVTPLGRYAYGVYDESGLLDLNVAGYPTGTTPIQSGRKGSSAFADLTAPESVPVLRHRQGENGGLSRHLFDCASGSPLPGKCPRSKILILEV